MARCFKIYTHYEDEAGDNFSQIRSLTTTSEQTLGAYFDTPQAQLPASHYPRIMSSSNLAGADDDVVDGDEDELDEEPHEPHDDEPDRRPRRHLGELLAVGLVAALDEADAVLGELAEGVHHGVDGVHGCCRREGEISETTTTTRSRA